LRDRQGRLERVWPSEWGSKPGGSPQAAAQGRRTAKLAQPNAAIIPSLAVRTTLHFRLLVPVHRANFRQATQSAPPGALRVAPAARPRPILALNPVNLEDLTKIPQLEAAVTRLEIVTAKPCVQLRPSFKISRRPSSPDRQNWPSTTANRPIPDKISPADFPRFLGRRNAAMCSFCISRRGRGGNQDHSTFFVVYGGRNQRLALRRHTLHRRCPKFIQTTKPAATITVGAFVFPSQLSSGPPYNWPPAPRCGWPFRLDRRDAGERPRDRPQRKCANDQAATRPSPCGS